MSDPTQRPDVSGRVRDWWDADAATYDDSSDHGWASADPWLPWEEFLDGWRSGITMAMAFSYSFFTI